MKIIRIYLLLLMASISSYGEVKEATFLARVVDESGCPVPNVTTSASYLRDKSLGSGAGTETHQRIVDQTDTNGTCAFAGKCNGYVDWSARKDGYYQTYGPQVTFTNETFNHFVPQGKLYEVVLRKIINPIPMYAKRLQNAVMPAYGIPLGYDLVKGDWLSPYGKGETADFIFRVDCQYGEKLKDGVPAFEAMLTLTFSNDGDGIQEIIDSPLKGSVFHLPRYAPEDGYANSWSLRAFESERKCSPMAREDMNYIFRVRTKKDEAGKIISALYGKIRGPIRYGVPVSGAKMSMKYYLNPTPNDRNLEFDPNQNLFKNLSPLEKVSEP